MSRSVAEDNTQGDPCRKFRVNHRLRVVPSIIGLVMIVPSVEVGEF